MADRFEFITKTPTWQLAVGWAVVAALLGAGWYFVYYADAVDQHHNAQMSLDKARTELDQMKTKLENFEQEMAKAEDMERQIEDKKRQLPLSEATIDHLMRKFQQQGRLVGVDVANWRPGSEERRDFYAKMPVEVSATGTWHQFGEFFRRVSEMEQIVNIEEVSMTEANSRDQEAANTLDVTFTASTFRFLEQQPAAAAGEPSDTRRRSGGEGN